MNTISLTLAPNFVASAESAMIAQRRRKVQSKWWMDDRHTPNVTLSNFRSTQTLFEAEFSTKRGETN